MARKRKVYSVGFTIHEAQNLATVKGQPVDPLVVVRCCGREYRTEVKYAKSNVVSWDESHAWTDIELSEEEWSTAYITFELQAANPFWRNTVLGVVTVQLQMIQLRKSHQIKKALPLQNPEDAEAHGLLRVTIFACAPGEAPPSPGEEVVEEEEDRADMTDLRKAVIDTQQAQEREPGAQLYHLYVSVYRLEDLAPSSSKSSRDPFVTCEFAGCKLKSTQARSCSSHAFNECFRIPVVTPLPEDAILVKVWDWNFMRPDELIAVGRLSFSELRTRQMLPRWFNLYGFDDTEVAQATRVAGQGGRLRANTYLGRLLLSARVERLTKDDLMAPHTVVARPHEDPAVTPIVLLADVYEVQGAPGTKVCVEIWCGSPRARTKWVTGEETLRQQRKQGAATSSLSKAVQGALGVAQYFMGGEETQPEDRFVFTETDGRIQDIRLAVPEDYKQQWDVLISVHARGCSPQLSGEARIAFQRLKMSKVPLHVPGTPRAPVWIPLYSTPPFESSKPPPAVLLTLEKSKDEAIARTKRKPVHYVDHQLRVYVYAARNLLSPSGALPNPFVQVSCAGLVRETVIVEQTSNPVFMDCLRLELPLATDPMRRLPTTPPVVLTLYERRSWGIQFLGRATCHYDRLRGKLRAGEAPTLPEPRWLKLRGGRYANKHIGDVLVLVELVRKRDAAEIPSFPMRPAVKMCTLTFSCLGLRNLYITRRATPVDYVAFRTGKVDKKQQRRRMVAPLVFVSASSYASAGRDRAELLCRYEHHPPEDPTLVNKQWRTATMGENADILKVESMEIDVPVDPVFDPRLVIQVYDRKRKPKYFVGEYSMSLVPLMPWILDQQAALEAIVPTNDFTDSLDVKQLSGLLRGFHGRGETPQEAHVGLRALSAADRETADAVKSASQSHAGIAGAEVDNQVYESKRKKNKEKKGKDDVNKEEDDEEGDPLVLRNFADSWLLPNGLPKILVASYSIPGVRYDVIYSNMFTLNVYIPAKFVLCAEGKRVADRKTKELYKRPSVQSTLESFLEDIAFPADFLRKAVLNEVDVTGQIKFFVDLSHGGQPNPYVDQDVAEWATNKRRLRERLRGADAYPRLLKVRVYVIRAISLNTAERAALPNPYLSFTVGDKRDTLRAEAKRKTLNPQFFTVWEKEAAFPEDSQLDVHVWSAEETITGALADYYIGSTCIDLEERWFSKEWRKYMEKNSVPMEYRPLRQSPAGAVRGTLEMWVELMDLQKAGEIPKFDLQHPAATEVEIRVIIWGARRLAFKPLGKDYIDAVIRCTLDCTGYRGQQPTLQQTDVHYYSKTGSALFNWRVIYSHIVMPVSTCVLQIAAYDFRNIGEAQFVGEVNLELRKYLESVATRLNSIEVDAELKLINKIKETPDLTTFGFVQVTLQFLSQPEATTKPVGLGRDPPNRDPRLMTPQEGRKWEDVLGSAGLRLDYRPLWFWVRVASVVFLSLWLFIICFLYPSLLK